jgi:spore maturation protein CgeB
MRILLYGEDWEGTHVNSIAKVLEELHVNHKIFDFCKYFLNTAASKNIINNYSSRIYNRLAYLLIEKKINKELLDCIDKYKPTTFFISKGVNIYPETLKIIADRSILIINWNPDDYFNKKNSSRNLLESLGIYDIVISSRSNRYAYYRSQGVKRIECVDWYYIPWLHRRVLQETVLENKILYIGAFSKKRDWFLSEISHQFPLEIYGGGWAKSKLLRKRKNTILTKQVLRQKDFPQKFHSAKINLNILNDLNFDETNLKLFEIPACSGFLLSSYSEASSSILNPDSECKYFKIWDLDDIHAKLTEIDRMSLPDYEEIRNSGYNKLLAQKHSLNDRVESLLKFFV